MTLPPPKGVGPDRFVAERSPRAHWMRVLVPGAVAVGTWLLGGWLDERGLDLVGFVSTLVTLWTLVDAVASLVDGRDRRVIETGEHGIWLPETGYRNWTDFADIRLEPAPPTTDLSTRVQPRLHNPRRLGFVPRDAAVTVHGPAIPRFARTIRRIRDRLVAIVVRSKAPGALLGVDEREIGRPLFERLVAAVANEVPLGGLDDPALSATPPPPPAAVAARRRATRGFSRMVFGAIGVSVALFLLLLAVLPPLDEPPGDILEPPPFEEPVTPVPAEAEITPEPTDGSAPEPSGRETTAPETTAPETTAPETAEPTPDPFEEIPPPSGPIQDVDLLGDVPPDAAEARLLFRANDGGQCCGPVDHTFYLLAYGEGIPETIREVWDQPMASEGEWATGGDGGFILTDSDLDSGLMLRAIGDDGAPMRLDMPFFEVTPGAVFHLGAQVRVAPGAGQSSTIFIVFYDGAGNEIGRQALDLPEAAE